jgi:hypothetical protein
MGRIASIHVSWAEGSWWSRWRWTLNKNQTSNDVPIKLPTFKELQATILERLKFPLKGDDVRTLDINLVRITTSRLMNNTIFIHTELPKLMNALWIQEDEWDYTNENLILACPEAIRIFKNWIEKFHDTQEIMRNILYRIRIVGVNV